MDPDITVSRQTVSRRLKENDLSGKRTRTVPFKTKKHLKDRVKFGKIYKNMDAKNFYDRKFLERWVSSLEVFI